MQPIGAGPTQDAVARAARHAAVRAAFDPPAGIYLDTATYGLPPRATTATLREALEAWASGSADWIAWDRRAEAARAAFARLIGAASDSVALQPAVSVAVAQVLAGLPFDDRREVLVAGDEFTSVLFPPLAAAEIGRLTVREVPFEALADEVRPSTALIAASHVRSDDGRVVDLAALREAAGAAGARILLDGSHAAGVVPPDGAAWGADYYAVAAYKWLLSPRGVAFLHVRPDRLAEIPPLAANWRAADDPYGRYYGGPLTLAGSAARLDVSLAWHAWVGAATSLGFLADLDPLDRDAWSRGLAARLADLLGVPAPSAAILSLRLADGVDPRRIAAAGIRTAARAGLTRVAPYLYNTEEEIETAAGVLAPLLDRSGTP